MSKNKRKQVDGQNLPLIPEKRYFTISEVSHLCAVKAYVLRYWETEFSQLKPVKRRGRRYYQVAEILLVRQIRKLLYDDGFTIEGARAQLTTAPEATHQVIKTNAMIKKIVAELEAVLTNLRTELVVVNR